MDHVMIEPLWRSLKYECIYLHAFETGAVARAGIGKWMTFYNHQRWPNGSEMISTNPTSRCNE